MGSIKKQIFINQFARRPARRRVSGSGQAEGLCRVCWK
ncbi:hypothetical protein D083_2647 [Dickeya solani RNS 08.23.3.1.A]|nr:hypothetical protein D083_2647 [Dickeya solani RNS 08.23.3.1.A]